MLLIYKYTQQNEKGNSFLEMKKKTQSIFYVPLFIQIKILLFRHFEM